MKQRQSIEHIAHGIFLCAGLITVGCVLLITVYLVLSGLPAIAEIGPIKFLTGKTWKPGADIYGIFPMIMGSIYVTGGAMLLGVPAFVIIYTAVEILVNRKLEKDNIPTDTALYVDLDYIDPETGEMVKVEKSEKPENEPGKNE